MQTENQRSEDVEEVGEDLTLSERVARATTPARASRQDDGSMVVEVSLYPLNRAPLPRLADQAGLMARIRRFIRGS